MGQYTPEVLIHLMDMILNSVIVVTCGATVLGLYYMSRSWHSLWALGMLCFLARRTFIRD